MIIRFSKKEEKQESGLLFGEYRGANTKRESCRNYESSKFKIFLECKNKHQKEKILDFQNKYSV